MSHKTVIDEYKINPNQVIKTVAKLDEPFVNSCVFPHPNENCINGTGINFEIFEIVMSTLGLNYTVVMAEEADTGFYRDGKWHGMLGQLVRHEVNMTATLVSITPERLVGVDFSSPASFYLKGFLIQRPNALDAAAIPTFLATPFSPSIWACFLISLVIYIFLVFAARLFETQSNERRPLQFFCDSILEVMRSPLNQTEPHPYSPALRFTLNYLYVPIFFLMNFYTASLTGTLMFMGKSTDPFQGYDELARLIRTKSFTMISTGSIDKFRPPLSNETADENHPETIIRQAFSYNPPIMVDTPEQAANLISKNKSLVFWSSYLQVLNAAAGSCNLRVIEDRYSMPLWLAFAFRKGDPLQTIVSRTLYAETSVESFMKRMFVKYTKHRRCSESDDDDDGLSSFFALGLRQMQGAYFILLYGIAVAAPAFLGEYLTWLVEKKCQTRIARIKAIKLRRMGIDFGRPAISSRALTRL